MKKKEKVRRVQSILEILQEIRAVWALLETLGHFKTACDSFFASLDQHHTPLRSLLTDRFQIIGQG
ncbi:MAG: hypothetical protein LUQ11_00220 [Methylococcaceae bacterium]|nr:hypothetical protein [Methylococcaceae bacterium]